MKNQKQVPPEKKPAKYQFSVLFNYLPLSIVISAYYFFLTVLGVVNLNLQYIWFDESNQFWISRGQSFSNQAGSADSSYSSILELNNSMNLDPGGYSLYLRLISDVFGTSVSVLRMSSYIFFIGFVSLGVFLAFKVSRNNTVRTLFLSLTSFLIFAPDVRWYAIEIRAYEYSLFSVLLLVVITTHFHKDSVIIPYIWLCVFTFTIGSRYTVIPYVLACYFILLSILFSTLKSKKYSIHYLVILVVSTLELWVMYMFIVLKQNRGNPPDYVKELMLTPSNFQNWDRIFYHNFLGFPGIFRLIVLMLLILLVAQKVTNFASRITLNARLIVILNSVTILQMFFSFLGLLPWESRTRWSIEDYSFSILAVFLIFQVWRVNSSPQLSAATEKFFVVVMSLTLVVVGVSNKEHFTSNFQRTGDINVFTQILAPRLTAGQTNLLIGATVYPEIRYLAERNGVSPEITKLWLDASIQQFDPSDLESIKNSLTANKATNSSGEVLISKYWDKAFESKVRNLLNEMPNAKISDIQERNTIGWLLVSWSDA
jgi:hypothetical protein